MAGSLGYHGAAVLAARGAQRAQPGLDHAPYAGSGLSCRCRRSWQAVMVSVWPPQGKLPGPHDAILLGPGLAAADMPDQMKMLTRHLVAGFVPAGGSGCQRPGLAAAGPCPQERPAGDDAPPRRSGAAAAHDAPQQCRPTG